MITQMGNPFGAIRTVKVGFSWTMLFFGFLVPLVRGDWKWVIISLVLDAVTCGLSWFVFPFIYNKVYIKGLIEKGWLPVNEAGAYAMSQKGIFVPGIAEWR